MTKYMVNIFFLVLLGSIPVLFTARAEADQQRDYGITAEEKGFSYRGNRLWPDYLSQSRPFHGGLGYPYQAYSDDEAVVRRTKENTPNLSRYWKIRPKPGLHPDGRGYGPPAYWFENRISSRNRGIKF